MAKSLKDEFDTPMTINAHDVTIKIGDDCNVQLEKGKKVLTVTEDRILLVDGGVTVDIRDGNISLSGGNIEVQRDGIAKVVPVAEKQEDEIAVITSFLYFDAIKPGDTLGVDHLLFGCDNRFYNWFVYNVEKDLGIIQVLEPEDMFGLRSTFVSHIEDDLKPQGHVGARVMAFGDVKEIFNNLILTNLIEKAPISLFDERDRQKLFFSDKSANYTDRSLAYIFDKRGTQCRYPHTSEQAYGFAVQDILVRTL